MLYHQSRYNILIPIRSRFFTISGALQPIRNTKITTSYYSAGTKTNMILNTTPTTPESRDEFQAIYMLVGISALICLFLFIIIVQLCKKSQSSKSQTVTPQSGDDNTLHSELPNHGNGIGYNVISGRPKDHSYRSFNVHYAEITERMEINAPNIQDNYESPEQLYENSPVTDGYFDPKYANCIDDIEEEIITSEDTNNSYLRPVFVKKV